MSARRVRWIGWAGVAAAVGAVAWSFAPRPVSVETARVERGSLVVTIDEDAQTRVRERYTVSAPVPGYLTRIAHRPGDVVQAGEPIARLMAAPPTPIDARSRSQLEARVESAVDALRQAQMRASGARAAVDQANRELDRHQQLQRDRVVSPLELESARTHRDVADADLKTAIAGVDVAQHDLEAARAALASGTQLSAGRTIVVPAPRDGTVLRVFEESERVVPAGTPLIELGEPAALEIVADLLSTDAVHISPGARVIIDRWGGEEALNGRVRLIEPSSFTKVSALGVEEQRVNVIIDFADPPAVWQRLGDGFALEVRIVTYESANALKVPAGALFRQGGDWAVYTVTGARAAVRTVTLRHHNGLEAEVLAGVSEGDTVIVHPTDRLADGVRVAVRNR